MRASGFSFPCSHPTSSKDEAFERFIKTAKKEPWKIHNPWPLLAGFKTYRQARTQPLIRTTYLPTTNTILYSIYNENFLSLCHEIVHEMNDYTPAKILARIVLSRAYEWVCDLVGGRISEREINKRWAELTSIKTHLSEICTAITFSEELIATAESLEVCASAGVKPETLDVLEKDIVAKCSNLLPYLNTFKKIMQLVDDDDRLFILLGMYLQGVKVCRSVKGLRINYAGIHKVWVVDSAKRCRILADVVNTMRSKKELSAWIRCRILEHQEEVKGFAIVKGRLDGESELSKESKYLRVLMEGGDIVANGNPARTPIVRNYLSTCVRAVVYPKEVNNTWYITRKVIPRSESSAACKVESEAIEWILFFDSLLEQLWLGNGICCPFYDPLVGCVCNSERKEALNRIARWAKEGKFEQGRFNRGKRKDLPQECNL